MLVRHDEPIEAIRFLNCRSGRFGLPVIVLVLVLVRHDLIL
jgi:hypothetical protein